MKHNKIYFYLVVGKEMIPRQMEISSFRLTPEDEQEMAEICSDLKEIGYEDLVVLNGKGTCLRRIKL